MAFSFSNAPLFVVASAYAKLIGKRVVVQDGLRECVSAQSTGTVSKAEAASLMKSACESKGLQVRTIDADTVRIEKN